MAKTKSEPLARPPAAPAVPLPSKKDAIAAQDTESQSSEAYLEATRAAQAHHEAYQLATGGGGTGGGPTGGGATGGAAYPLATPAMEPHEDPVRLALSLHADPLWKQIISFCVLATSLQRPSISNVKSTPQFAPLCPFQLCRGRHHRPRTQQHHKAQKHRAQKRT
jgi:hypothetical protein